MKPKFILVRLRTVFETFGHSCVIVLEGDVMLISLAAVRVRPVLMNVKEESLSVFRDAFLPHALPLIPALCLHFSSHAVYFLDGAGMFGAREHCSAMPKQKRGVFIAIKGSWTWHTARAVQISIRINKQLDTPAVEPVSFTFTISTPARVAHIRRTVCLLSSGSSITALSQECGPCMMCLSLQGTVASTLISFNPGDTARSRSRNTRERERVSEQEQQQERKKEAIGAHACF